jgi:uncharacterized Fe-S cluster protein YjdI
VTYDTQVCIHAGNCVKSLPAVFKVVEGQFVIDQRDGSEAAIRQTVAAYPSGALRITADAGCLCSMQGTEERVISQGLWQH